MKSYITVFTFIVLAIAGYLDRPCFCQTVSSSSGEIMKTSPQVQKALKSGKLTKEQMEKGLKAIQSGKISEKEAEAYKKKLELGTLTPEEIKSAKKLFELEKQKLKQEATDVVYLYGNVLSPGEYPYEPGMRVLDLIPDLDSLDRDTHFDYALIRRHQLGKMEMDIEEKPEDKKVKSTFAVTEDGLKVELIPFDLGKLLFAKDESQNILLMPRDEIFIFNKDTIKDQLLKPELVTETEKKEEFEEEDLKREEIEEPLEIFGHNLFEEVPSTFAPITSIPVSNNYIIGPGDEINVLMWGRIDESHSLEVNNEGMIVLPKVGPLTVAGLTFGELKELIKHKAEAITGVNVNVSMGALKTIQVFVLGEVKSPGIYTVSSLASVMNALLSSGGPTKLGSLRNVQLKRNGEVIATIDLYDFLLNGDTTSDVGLMPGDVIFIPQAGPMVSIKGNVKRKAIYELKSNRSLKNALRLAGGLAPGAFDQRIQIERSFKNKEQIVLDIAYNDLSRQGPVSLQDGDVINVFGVLPDAVNAVYLYGNVKRPGMYAYHEGIRIRDIIPDLDQLDKETYYKYAIVKRYHKETGTSELLPFNIGKLLIKKDESQNLPLQPLDEIHVFNREDFEDKPYAVVKGEVRKPGKYFIDDMRIKDLILRAGDLTRDAYMPKAELIRVDSQRVRHTIYFNITLAMAGDPEHNLQVQNEDTLVIHSIKEEMWEKHVSIRGEVRKPDRYLLTQGMTIKDLIFKAGNCKPDAYLETGHLQRIDPKTRESTIHSFNVKKAMEGDPEHNLVLEDQDDVLIHSIWEYKEKYTVSISGQVRNPGEYPYAANMTINDLILIAGNVRDNAYMEEAELVRFSIVDGREVQTSIIRFNIRKAQQNDPEHNLKLEPLDMITIKEIPEWWEKKREITISGEVYFPGTYQIRKDERLSDVIIRAGGFTDYAYLQGAIFTRESVRKVQQARIDEMMEKLETDIARLSSEEVQSSLSAEDLALQQQLMASHKNLLEKLKKTKATGRVVINLQPLEKFKGTSSDMVLQAGDTLAIPKRPYTVNVVGAVYNPTALIHDEKHPELQYYLSLTGGPTDNADTSLMYIIKTNGTVVSKASASSWWKKFENIHLNPGDTVLVPEKVQRPNYLRDAKDISEILYQIAVTAGITITQIF